MKNLIGKKVRGFKFESRESCGYVSDMDVLIGCIGVVQVQDGLRAYVKFDDNAWWYPTNLIEQHLVEDELPQPVQYINPNGDIINTIVDAYFNGTSLPQIKESIRQAYTAIEAGVNAQLVEIKEERGKI